MAEIESVRVGPLAWIGFGDIEYKAKLPNVAYEFYDLRTAIAKFRDNSESRYLHYVFETNQRFKINDEIKTTQAITNKEKTTVYGGCKANQTLKIGHFFETSTNLPITGTKFEIIEVKENDGFARSYLPGSSWYTDEYIPVEGAKAIPGTIGDDGIAEVEGCHAGKTYMVTFSPNVSQSDIDKLYESYQPILKHLTVWLVKEWGANESDAQDITNELFKLSDTPNLNKGNMTPEQQLQQLTIVSQKLQQASQNNNDYNSFEKKWQEFLRLDEAGRHKLLAEARLAGIGKVFVDIWEMLVGLYEFFRNFEKNMEKIKKFFGDLTMEQIEQCMEQIMLVLNDKGLLFIVYSAVVKWLIMLPPQEQEMITANFLFDFIISIVGGAILKVGAKLAINTTKVAGEMIADAAGKAARAGSKAFDASKTALTRLMEKLLEVIQKAEELIAAHLANLKKLVYHGQRILTVPALFTVMNLASFLEKVRLEYRKIHNNPGETPNKKPSCTTSKTCTHGEPISMVTGEELLTLTDTTLKGLLPFAWRRLYRTSAAEINHGLGFGWSHSLAHSLIQKQGKFFWTTEENLTLELPLPTEEIPAGVNPLGEAAAYLGKDSNEYILAQAHGQGFYHFRQTKSGFQLESISDKYNNRIYLLRDITGKINRVHNGAGRALLLRYHNGHIIGVDYQQEIAGDTYEASWKTLQTIATYHYNPQNQLTKVTNTLGETEHYHYDEHNVIQQRAMAGGAVIKWQWEGQGKQARCIEQSSNIQASAQYQWDDNGTVTVKLHDGTEEVYTHDQAAKLIKQINRDGGELLKAYDESGNLIAERSPTGAETLYQYDQDNRLRFFIPSEGEPTQYGYDQGYVNRIIQGDAQWLYERNPQGDITQQTDPQGNITRYQYTETGKIKTIRYPDASQHLLTWNKLGQLIEETLPQGGTRRYRYDSLGNQIIRQDERNQVTQFSYDALGRIITITYPDKTSKQFKYNAYSNITESIDEQGRITRYQYLPNLHKVSAKINPDGSQVHYQYNNQLNLTGITNEQGERYHLDYYPNGLISQETGFDGRKTSYQYDLGGNLIAKTDYDDQGKEYTTTYLRSPEGKLLQKTLPDGKKINYGYNGQGLLTRVDDEQWPLNYEYDITGKLTAEHQGWATLRYQYSPLGILSQCKLPDGNVIDYKYQKGGQLAQINLNDQKLTEHFYSLGQEVERQQGSLTSQYDYDEQGRLKTHFVNTSQKNLYQRKYQYSANGNLAAIEDSRKGIRQYHYDPLDRLVQVRGDISEDLIHDPAGNLLAQDHKTQQANVKGNRLLMQGDKHFIYDSFGNLIQEARGQGQKLVTQYQYDSQQQLIQATMPDGTSASYQYDAFGRRISKTVTDKTGQKTKTEFIWLGEKLLAESSKGHYQSYLYELGTFKPLALLKGKGKKAEVYYYQLDHLGTPQELTTANGSIAWSAKYKAYGNLALQEQIHGIEQPLRFQGQYHDLETGLYYNRNRYYSPDTGRYITLDPIKLAGGLNSYHYCTNPTGWIDPLGLSDECPGVNSNKKTNPETDATVNSNSPKPPSPRIQRKIDALRRGEDVHVRNAEEAREVLDNMPELKPGGGGSRNPEFMDGPNTYRGDLINKSDPTSAEIHPSGPHANRPHYNLTLRVFNPDGSMTRLKPAIFFDD